MKHTFGHKVKVNEDGHSKKKQKKNSTTKHVYTKQFWSSSHLNVNDITQNFFFQNSMSII